jgi:hypothetical protein
MTTGTQVIGAQQSSIQSRGTAPAIQAATPTQPHGPAPATVQAAATAQPAKQAANAPQARAVATVDSAVVPTASTSFALLGPFGDEISDDRPEFTWQPLAGVTKYSVILVDEGLRPIAHTRVKTTSWRPRKPLRRGRTYLWQVTAILRNGTKVLATGPTSAEARIHIAPPSSGKHSDK